MVRGNLRATPTSSRMTDTHALTGQPNRLKLNPWRRGDSPETSARELMPPSMGGRNSRARLISSRLRNTSATTGQTTNQTPDIPIQYKVIGNTELLSGQISTPRLTPNVTSGYAKMTDRSESCSHTPKAQHEDRPVGMLV